MIYTYNQLIDMGDDLNNHKSIRIDDIVESLLRLDNLEKINSILSLITNRSRNDSVTDKFLNESNKYISIAKTELSKQQSRAEFTELYNKIKAIEDKTALKFYSKLTKFVYPLELKPYQHLAILDLWINLFTTSIERCLDVKERKEQIKKDFYKITSITTELAILLRKQDRINEANCVLELAEPEIINGNEQEYYKILNFNEYVKLWKNELTNNFIKYTELNEIEAKSILNKIKTSVEEALKELFKQMDKNLYKQQNEQIKQKVQIINYARNAEYLKKILAFTIENQFQQFKSINN